MNNLFIPQGEKEITINLSVKEALLLSGEKFEYDKSTYIEARKKVKQQLAQELEKKS